MTKLTCGRRKESTEDNSGVVRKRFSWLAVCVVVLSLSCVGLGQELAATLTGTVTDSSGAVVGGATIIVHNEDTGADVRSLNTSSTGSFNITNLPAGHYTVTVKNSGFQTFVAKDVNLDRKSVV